MFKTTTTKQHFLVKGLLEMTVVVVLYGKDCFDETPLSERNGRSSSNR